jgi:hypothetical protein
MSKKKNKDGQALTQYEPNSYRGGGRPAVRGRRTGRDVLSKVSESFLADLADDWEMHGKLVLEKVRADDPSTYLRVLSAIAPKQVELGMTDSLADFLLQLNEKKPNVIDGSIADEAEIVETRSGAVLPGGSGA